MPEIWMRKLNGPPEPKKIGPGGDDLGKLMHQGWRQCSPPKGAAPPPKPQIDEGEGD